MCVWVCGTHSERDEATVAAEKRQYEAEAMKLRQEEEEKLRQLAKEKAEAHRRAMKRQAAREKEAEEGAEPPKEQRSGSARRRSYSAKEKLKILLFLDSVKADKMVTRKKATFEADKRSRGARWNMANSDWATAETRPKIERAAAKEHAASLLRIDKESRKKGKSGASTC